MHFADTARADQADVQFRFHRPESLLNGSQILPVAGGAFLWGAYAGQHILLRHQHVACVLLCFQPAKHSGEIDAFAQFAEHPMAQGFEVIPIVLAGLVGNILLAVLEVI
ncbi:MAG: hypothetical protein U0R19_21825 [Bryobacteraceae bacterium]